MTYLPNKSKLKYICSVFLEFKSMGRNETKFAQNNTIGTISILFWGYSSNFT